MRVVLQRVSTARVTVAGRVTGAIGRGYLLLVGFRNDDTEAALLWMADKVVALRLFPDTAAAAMDAAAATAATAAAAAAAVADAAGAGAAAMAAGTEAAAKPSSFSRGLADVEGALLVVSQFTLYGDSRKGRRPSFSEAAPPDIAIPLYDRFVALLRERAPGRVETGEFGAMMDIELVNDGPVTLVLER
jgi:D-aminoacyl-tRNA deacylase